MDVSSLKVGVTALVSAGCMLVGGVSYISKVEAKADQAVKEATEANNSIKEMQRDLVKQRVLIAEIQADSKAILRLVSLQSGGSSQ
jgi:outer membrane murein-binding lipoprotein Lpp|tara:strand:+ start:496 stop:753 length:258 start_codon:yes stop_codon:yes gene_type:complete